MTAAATAVPVRILSVRTRLQAQDLQPPPVAVVEEQPAAKTPRVFRLGDAQGKDPPVRSQEGAPVEPARHRRAVNVTKRPGPVWRMVSGPTPSVTAAATPQAGQPSRREQLEQLRMMLAGLEQTFDQIRFAQAFQIDLPGQG